MLKVVVCSVNPVKILAVKEAFLSFFDEIDIKSMKIEEKKVFKQPLTEKQTLDSALTRIENARKLEKADYYASMEGGIGKDEFGAYLTWYVCICNDEGKKSVAGGGRMPFPSIIFNELYRERKKELGDIIDELADDENTKQKGGAIAIFTGNRVMRKDIFKRDLIIALIPFTSEIYQKIDK